MKDDFTTKRKPLSDEYSPVDPTYGMNEEELEDYEDAQAAENYFTGHYNPELYKN